MTPSWYKRELGPGDSGPDVEIVQRRLHSWEGGTYGPDTEARVRGLQRLFDLPMTGEVDEATAEAIGESARAGLPPLWFERELKLDDYGEDVFALRMALEIPVSWEFDEETDRAVRRFQSGHGIQPDGIVTKELATRL